MCLITCAVSRIVHPCVQDEAPAVSAKSKKVKAADVPKSSGIGKDPTTHTAFLPDKEREKKEQQMREQLKQEYELRQQVCIKHLHPCKYALYFGRL